MRKNNRAWALLRVLSCSRLDPMAIAPDALALVRSLIPNAAGMLFLTSHDGMPHAFFHEDSPQSARDIFIREPQLFMGPKEFSVFQLAGSSAFPKAGRFLEPPPGFYSSNSYQLLHRPAGHHHFLESRLEVDGRRCGVISVTRGHGKPFDQRDLANLEQVARYVEHAIKSADATIDADWTVAQEAMLVARADGSILFGNTAVDALLADFPHIGAMWPDRRRLPGMFLHLIERLRDGQRYPDRMPSISIPVPGAYVEASAHWLLPPAATPRADADPAALTADAPVGIVLRRRVPAHLTVLERLREAELTPRELEVGFWLALGKREAVRANLPISEAVLRDCVKVLFDRFDCNSQEDFQQLLRQPARPL